MKNTFGKIGLGLAGAVAAVGLMSAGVQTAQAEFTIDAPPGTTTPVQPTSIVPDGGNFLWTYDLSLNGSAPASAGSYFTFALPADSGVTSQSDYVFNLTGGLGNIYTGTLTSNTLYQAGSGAWTIYENVNDYSATAYYKPTSSSTTLATGPIGSFGIITSEGYLGTTTVPFPAITVNTVSYDFYSNVNSSGGSQLLQVVVPSQTGNIPESPLPLPAAFWPGLLTLGGMAVVGGLRLRRRTV